MSKLRSIVTAIIAALLYAAAGYPADDAVQSGTVTYAETAGSYTYLQIEEAGKQHWLAAQPLTVAVGDQVEYAGGDVMQAFTSKALNKTFESIRFVSRIHVVSKDLPPDAMQQGVISETARAADGTTVGEIFETPATLAGKTVALRARVIKVNRNILGMNWVTLSDGTGQSPDDSIVATTQETPAVGDIVTAVGPLKTNVNLGAGYEYKVLMENAHFTE
jgi:hypothetical protein